MSRSCFIVLNDIEQRLYSEGSLMIGYFNKRIDAQMYAISRYEDLAKNFNRLLFTNIKRMIYDD